MRVYGGRRIKQARPAVFFFVTTLAAGQVGAPYRPYKESFNERRVVAERLASPDPADLAWGATLAANYRQSEFVPRIVELLSIQDRYLPYYALDALIRMEADAPDAMLLPLADKFFEPVVILLARDPGKHGAGLMQLLAKEKSNYEWVVLNSILAEHRPPGYVERLWHEWTLRTRLEVTDPRGVGPGSGGGCGFDHAGMGSPSGFPRLPNYFINDRSLPSMTVLAGGPHPLSYSSIQKLCWNDYGVSRDEYRLDYLREMTHFQNPKPRGHITFTSVEHYRREAELYRATLLAFWHELRRELVSRKLIPDSDEAKPAIEIVVKDSRRERVPAATGNRGIRAG